MGSGNECLAGDPFVQMTELRYEYMVISLPWMITMWTKRDLELHGTCPSLGPGPRIDCTFVYPSLDAMTCWGLAHTLFASHIEVDNGVGDERTAQSVVECAFNFKFKTKSMAETV